MGVVVSNFVGAIASILNSLLELYKWIIIIAALITWVSPDPYNPIVRFLYSVTDPVLRPVRRRIGIVMGIDISPLIVILIIVFIQMFFIASLRDIANGMR
jgi:YggT family protein